VFAQDLIKAYGLLPYQRVYLTSKEENWLSKYGEKSFPGFFQVIGSSANAEIFTVGNVRVGLVAFPDLGPEYAAPEAGKIEDVLKKARALRPQVKLLIGVSSWGVENERAFINQSEPLFDLVLGGGVGRGLDGEVNSRSGALLVRSFTKGQYMNIVDVLAWPDSHSDKKWRPGETVRYSIKELGSQIPDDPAFQGLFKEKKHADSSRKSDL
jgi:hypothetical protein